MKKRVIALTGALMAAAFIGTAGQAQSSDDKTSSAGSTPNQAPKLIAWHWGWHKQKNYATTQPATEQPEQREQPAQPAGRHEGTSKAVWNDVPTGFALAKREHKPIITDFYTDWCGWCKIMEKKTFENSEVERFMVSNFVLVRANAEDHAAGQRLSEANRIDGYPTIIIFDESGRPRATMVGYQKVAPFMDKLNAFLAGKPIPADE